MRFAIIVHVYITHIPMTTVSQPNIILYLEAIFVKDFFAEMILFVLHFQLWNITGDNDIIHAET